MSAVPDRIPFPVFPAWGILAPMNESTPHIPLLAESLAARLEMEESLGIGYLPAPLPDPLPGTPVTPSIQHADHSRGAHAATTRFAPRFPVTEHLAAQEPCADAPCASRVQGVSPVEPVAPVHTGSSGRVDAIAPCVHEALACRKCRLCGNRRHVVFGEGCLDTDVVFLSDMPGREEDLLGRPFQGLTGALLTQIIEGAFSRKRGAVYLTTLLKCRPKGSRIPKRDEAEACLPYFRRELDVIQPRILVVFGEHATRILQGGDGTAPFEPGTWFEFAGIDVMPTLSLATIQRERRHQGRGNAYDKAVWLHLQKVLRRLQME